MLVDWFTVGAQALNFVVLVWLMKRFLYGPILRAIDAREERIAARLADADARKAEALAERTDFARKNQELDQQRAALLAGAKDEAEAERTRLVEEARKAADALSRKRQEAMKADALALGKALRLRVQKEVFGIARRALRDLSTTSLEERLCDVFTRRLREMDPAERDALGAALEEASEPALLQSAFELPDEQRTAIRNALDETFATEVRVRFETAPDLVSGIALTTNGRKLSWSISGYLGSLEEGVSELVNGPAKPAPGSP
jgi:F-type H+-transporting ATPase subunit b